MKKRSLMSLLPYVAIALVSWSCEQMKAPPEIELEGRLKIAFVSAGGPFSVEIVLFLLSDDEVYHLTFDPSCQIKGGGQESAETGYPLNACGTTVALHSDATYRVVGRDSPTGEQLFDRKTNSLLVEVFEILKAGEGESYANMGFRTEQGAIFVTDGRLRIYRRQGMPAFSSDGAVINMSEPAPWAVSKEGGDK